MQTSHSAADARETAITIIMREHQVLEAVLQTLLLLINDIEKRHSEPDFRLFATILYYIEDFHGEYHHPKEEKYLFSALRYRAPNQTGVLAELEAEHAGDAAMIAKLQRTLVRYQGGARDGFGHFKATVDLYVASLLHHMHKEGSLYEHARECLTVDDWCRIAAAFAANRDPLAGPAPREEFQRLYQRIVIRLPSKFRLPSLREIR